jgi:TRAP transporter 4TM/12TM fusion protein
MAENDSIKFQGDEDLVKKSDDIVRKLDKESATRVFSNDLMKKFFYILSILVACYHLYTAAFGPPVTLVHRSIHVGMMLSMCFMMYPFRSGHSSNTSVPWYDWILVLLSLAAPIYIYTDYIGVVERAGRASTPDMWMATLLVVLVLGASRQCHRLGTADLEYDIYCLWFIWPSVPGIFAHRGYSWIALSNHFFANTEGIYGTSVSVASSYIFLFILFGCVMNKCGMGLFFNDLALALAGGTKGGPAKVSVLASGLLGSINGSAVANVVTTGAFTIPLMKKIGYSKEFAGAVEASASVGGQLIASYYGRCCFYYGRNVGRSVFQHSCVGCSSCSAVLSGYYDPDSAPCFQRWIGRPAQRKAAASYGGY